MKRNLLSMSLLLATLAGAQPVFATQPNVLTSAVAASALNVTAPDPAQNIRDAVRLLRSNDLAGLMVVLMPPAQVQVLRGAYEMKRAEPTTDEDRAQFEEGFAKLMAPDAVNKLMAEIEPKLVEARPQAPGALMMGFGALQMAISSPESDLSPEHRESLKRALPSIQSWATSTDFLSSQSLRQALTLVTEAARSSGVSNLDQLKMLSFEEVLARASNVLAASKKALRIYGLDVDAIIASTQVEVIAIEGDKARVRTTVTVFDAPISKEHELVLVEGRWYGQDALIHFNNHEHKHGHKHVDVQVDVES